MFEQLVQSLKKPAEEELKSTDFRNPKVGSVNKTDVQTLMSVFGTFGNICNASQHELVLCPGMGDKKDQIDDVDLDLAQACDQVACLNHR
ncbi:hypothetical protein B484DRAFT_410946 [Ochromonadaceae sp. CCMP2298]|nr:hypothetical protein B484DRAFT_410946 [Ochromonadaceae sp. CCMP2298]